MTDLKTISFNKEKYTYLSAEKSHQLAFELALVINQKIKNSQMEKPEIVIGIARGALAWIKTLADWLNIDEISTLRLVHYTNIGQRLTKPTILHSCLPRVDKKRVLIFDNIVETGKTMKMAVDYLSMCGAEKIRTSSLFYKKTSIIKPDFYSLKTDAWIVFYFEIMETVKLLGSRWNNEGLDLKKIKQRFLKIGLPQNEVSTAMKTIFNFS